MAGDRLPGEALAELRLIVSELVTNAVRHGLAREGWIELAIAVDRGKARVDVTDGGGGFAPPRELPAPEEPGGWGLVVVDRLASNWGIDGGASTRVWAELPVDSFGAPGGGATEPVYARNV